MFNHRRENRGIKRANGRPTSLGRKVVALVKGCDFERVKDAGIGPSAPPPFGPWVKVEPVSNAVFLTDTYGFHMARAAYRAQLMQRPTLIEIDIEALDRQQFQGCPVMVKQGDLMAKQRGLEFMHRMGLFRSRKDDPVACLEKFGAVWYRGTIPPDAFFGAVRISAPGHPVFAPIPEPVGTLTSFPTIRKHVKPVHDWIVDGATYPVPLTRSHEPALLAEDAAWARDAMTTNVKARIERLL